MKKVVLVLMLCFGVMACAVEQDGADLSVDESAVTLNETEIAKAIEVAPKPVRFSGEVKRIFGVEDAGEGVQSCYIGSAPCNGTWNCAFECCSGAVRTVVASCGECLGRANSWCGSGVRQAWWY